MDADRESALDRLLDPAHWKECVPENGVLCVVRPEVTAARAELRALRERVGDLEAVRDAAKELIDIHDDNDDDSPFPSILVHERNAVKAAIQRLNAGDAVRVRRALRGET